jgi:hypothetical protein
MMLKTLFWRLNLLQLEDTQLLLQTDVRLDQRRVLITRSHPRDLLTTKRARRDQRSLPREAQSPVQRFAIVVLPHVEITKLQ